MPCHHGASRLPRERARAAVNLFDFAWFRVAETDFAEWFAALNSDQLGPTNSVDENRSQLAQRKKGTLLSLIKFTQCVSATARIGERRISQVIRGVALYTNRIFSEIEWSDVGRKGGFQSLSAPVRSERGGSGRPHFQQQLNRPHGR
jgi:hypothetical protein